MQKAGSLVVQGAHGLHPQQTRYFNATEIRCTGFFRSVVTKKRRESAHARILEGILNGELRACVDSRRFFVTTDLKNPVETVIPPARDVKVYGYYSK